MMIPLSKLVSFNNLYIDNSEVDPDAYMAVTKYGDLIETGKVKGISLDKVQIWRESSWRGITGIFLEDILAAIGEECSQGECIDDDTYQKELTHVATQILEQLGVEVTQANCAELLREVARRDKDPRAKLVRRKRH
jgi:hypothetical protein